MLRAFGAVSCLNVGVKDLIIINTPDALLVANKDRSQEVSQVVAKLKQLNRIELEQQLRNHRPWGYFETRRHGPGFQVKLLHVKRGGKLSMQKHFRRSEHWIVVRGRALVTIDGIGRYLEENHSGYISAT